MRVLFERLRGPRLRSLSSSSSALCFGGAPLPFPPPCPPRASLRFAAATTTTTVQVCLVGQNFWTVQDPWTGKRLVIYQPDGEIEVDGLLKEFTDWSFHTFDTANPPRYNFLNNVTYNFDNAQLMSMEDFQGSKIGYACVVEHQ
jgi:hypothetical protein